MGQKLKALACYPTEMIGGRHPRSFDYIEALARVRGGHSGYLLAEAFVSVRERLGRPPAARCRPKRVTVRAGQVAGSPAPMVGWISAAVPGRSPRGSAGLRPMLQVRT